MSEEAKNMTGFFKAIEVLAAKLQKIQDDNNQLKVEKEANEAAAAAAAAASNDGSAVEDQTSEPAHNATQTEEQNKLMVHQTLDQAVRMIHNRGLSYVVRNAAIEYLRNFLENEMFAQLSYIDEEEHFWHEVERVHDATRKELIKQLADEIIKGSQIYTIAEERVRVKLEQEGIIFGSDIDDDVIPQLYMLIDEITVIQARNTAIAAQIIDIKLQDYNDPAYTMLNKQR